MKTKRLHYEAPTIEVVPMEMEGVIAASGLDTMPGVKVSTSSPSGSASYQDISDMVEELFTIE